MAKPQSKSILLQHFADQELRPVLERYQSLITIFRTDHEKWLASEYAENGTRRIQRYDEAIKEYEEIVDLILEEFKRRHEIYQSIVS